MRYQKQGECEACQQKATLLWHPTGPWKGKWLCYSCSPDRQDELADAVKALAKLEGTSREPPKTP